jgi:hypothetical protein
MGSSAPAVLAQAACVLAVVDDAGAGRKRVGVMADPLEGLAGAREPGVESFERVGGSLERPSQRVGELVCGARLADARQQCFDGTIVRVWVTRKLSWVAGDHFHRRTSSTVASRRKVAQPGAM